MQDRYKCKQKPGKNTRESNVRHCNWELLSETTQHSYTFWSHIQQLGARIYIRNGNNIHENLFAKAEAVTYMKELELHDVNS